MNQENLTFSDLVKCVRETDSSPVSPDSDAIESISDEAIERRKVVVVEASANVPFNERGPNPKQAFRVCISRLMLDPEDPKALAYIPVGLRFRRKGDTFGKSALSRIWCQFHEILPESICDQIFDEVTTYDGWLTGGTENHIAMRRTAGYLFGESFPDATFHPGLSGRELADVCLEYFRAYGRSLIHTSMVEFLSPIYHAVNTAPWVNIAEFAEDERARLYANSILDTMLADLALNSHQGIIIPPAARAKGLMTDSYQLSTVRSNTQWTAWLYWGAGHCDPTVEAVTVNDSWNQSPLVLHAASTYLPNPVIRRIAMKQVPLPYRTLSACGNREVMGPAYANPHGLLNPPERVKPNPQSVMRSTYVHEQYAIGAGIRCADIEEPTLRHAHSFAVIWRDTSPRNWLFCVHPYWYVNREEDGARLGLDDWSGTSPFLQTVHWENAAVLLLDVPERDPYAGQAVGSNEKWTSDRPEQPYGRFHTYVPETVEEVVDTGMGVCLRVGQVYVSIRPVRGEATWEATGRVGYRRLVIEGNLVGAVVEVGSEEEYGGLAAFVEQVGAASLDDSALVSSRRVVYTSTRGHVLDIQHRGEEWRPAAKVNGAAIDYAKWPMCESAYVRREGGVMEVEDGESAFRVDWRGEEVERREIGKC